MCETCNIEFLVKNSDNEETLSKNIQVHKSYHAEGKFRSCNECFSVFKTLKQLENHKQAVHEISKSSQYQCKNCSTTFSTALDLKKHLASTKCKNASEKSFQCYICNEIFTMGIAKKRHIQVINFF